MSTQGAVEIVRSDEVGMAYDIKQDGQVVGRIIHNGDGWRACHMPGMRAFSPVGMDELDRVKAYAVREFQKEAA